MKRIVFALICLLTIAVFAACLKTTSGYTACSDVAVTTDSPVLIHFAADSITPLSKDTSGLYFQILDSGSGVSPVSSSGLVLTYTAELMDQTVFDQATNSNLQGLQLYQLIEGMQIGLKKIKKGGHIKLLIPSALAWGCAGLPPAVPSNAPVYFNVQLIDVN
ncbi:MAG TPA: FKBP-type peptidyl-prolyl cis-trans isomerase [Puia sp.]|nr:FKBP-type peptidyl-prolyl cis-trans isomerase [Puia sp.]